VLDLSIILLSMLTYTFVLVLTRPATNPAQHYSLFPLALGQILRTHAVAEMHLTLNAGRWRYDDWGTPPPVTDEVVDTGSLGTGGELRAWFAEGGPVGCVILRCCSSLPIHEHIDLDHITDTMIAMLMQTRCPLVRPAQLTLGPVLRLALRNGRPSHHLAYAHIHAGTFANSQC
jgi:hypothetical protein